MPQAAPWRRCLLVVATLVVSIVLLSLSQVASHAADDAESPVPAAAPSSDSSSSSSSSSSPSPPSVNPSAELAFERDVRPILKTHCFHCHGEGDELAGGLDLRLRRLILAGGDSGPAISPNDPDGSPLVERIRAREMPPEDVALRPTEKELERIGAWVSSGAFTLREEPAEIAVGIVITDEERSFWSFQPVIAPPPPTVNDADRVRSPIDRFVLARLEGVGASFAPDAPREALARRLSMTLLGLPPTPDDVAEFVADTSPDAYERLVDRLLASPQYGERWGRHWLDVAGYADSEGVTDTDAERNDAYKYRDYVIRSIGADKPFDQFIIEQLAGDELVRPPYAELPPEDTDKLIATGFLRMAPDGTADGGIDRAVAANQTVADTIQIVSTSLLGMTVACAQCHHHRYDPIPQDDYYRLRAIFEPAFHTAAWKVPAARRVSLYRDSDRQAAEKIEQQAKEIEQRRTARQDEHIERVFNDELAKLPEEVREPIRAARNTPEKERTDEQKKLLMDHPSTNVTAGSLYLYDNKAADELKKMAEEATALRATKPKEEFVRALAEPLDQAPPPTHLFHRGDHEQPKQEVAPAELSVLAKFDPPAIAANDESLPTSGRRLAYARWLTSGRHPLVSRVLVNRVWMHHFGRGLVETPADFGRLGVPPTHPDLLDWMADRFVRDGWSLKRLHRTILCSTVFRQSSTADEALAAADPDNRLLGRMSVRRIDAETMRDSLLAIDGRLWLKPHGPPIPVMADNVGQFVIGVENLNAGRPGEVIAMNGEEFRRSVYVQVRRSRPLSVLDTFDAPRMEPNCAARASTTVATQSLLMMNSQFTLDSARALAERLIAEQPDDRAERIARAWRLVYGRSPTGDEQNDAAQFLDEQQAIFDLPNAEASAAEEGAKLALVSLCHALLSSNEFLYVD